MRPIIELVIIVGLVVLGWNQSFQEQLNALLPPKTEDAAVVKPSPPPVATQPVSVQTLPHLPQAGPTPTPSTDWINKPTMMDKPFSDKKGH
jgi:hypothetical protein